MDFSTPIRSLESLGRRKPPLSDDIVSLSRQLLDLYGHDGDDSGVLSSEYGTMVLQMIELGSADPNAAAGGNGNKKARWEPLAVGLNLANDYLERLCGSIESGKGKHGGTGDGSAAYFEGPRVPTLTAEPSVATAAGSIGESESVSHEATSAEANGSESASSTNAINLEEMVQFCATLLDSCQTNLEHDEPRVRSLVAKTVGSHARLGEVLAQSSSNTDATKDPTKDKAITELTTQRRALYKLILTSLHTQLTLGRDTSGEKSKDSTGALDDTTGWRSVETSLNALAAYVGGCGGTYVMENFGGLNLLEGGTSTLLGSLRYCSVEHVNRHVRAAGVQVLEQLIGSVVAASASADTSTADKSDAATATNPMEMLTSPTAPLRIVIIDVLKTTLADNWSQVRMAGSVLNRVYLTSLLHHVPDPTLRSEVLTSLYPILLPRMCLNRFYLAQGVKLYSHETWRLVFASGEGLQCVAENAAAVCRYYVKMCDADNHAVREAACQAVAELAYKIGSHPTYADYLSPYVPMLLQGLLMCFHDESWPVRDEACLACGIFCRAYPEECRPDLKTLFERWTEQLTDQIWSVRENAAVALGDAIVAYGQPMFDEVLAVVKKNLPTARDQPAMTREEYKRRQNDIDAHTDSQLYSCGSLAPKLRKGGAGRIGCCNGALTRERMPWEATDGTIYLIRELCVRCTGDGEASAKGIVLTDEVLLPLMTELADVCRVKHFPQSDDMRATLWRQLPVMANALGKNRFKRQYLHIFMDLLISNLDADRSGSGASQLSVHAAGQCAEELAKLVGVNIFRGRLEEDWQKAAFDNAMQERQRTANMGPPVEAGFSPFGPAGLIPGAGAAPSDVRPGAAAGGTTASSQPAFGAQVGFDHSLSI